MDRERLECRRAIEALRGGVPNESAVRRLGAHQPDVERLFLDELDRLGSAHRGEAPPRGLLLKGGFGAGKSHVLQYLKGLALRRGFVCSTVAIGKETTLHDIHRVFEAAVESAEAEGVFGPLIEEVADRRVIAGGETIARLLDWAESDESCMPALFPATVQVFASPSVDRELKSKIARFWSGEKLSVPEVRQGLKASGLAGRYDVRTVPIRELGFRRFVFASRLLREAGFRGWVVFLDEVEQINKSSLLQRGKAYAEIARWMGSSVASPIPGVVAVLAITDDFATWAFDERHDLENVPARLATSSGADPGTVERAQAGMNALRAQGIALRPLDEGALEKAFSLVRKLYWTAYDWEPPAEEPPLQADEEKPMRLHVRRWVNSWDLLRIYGVSAAPEMVEESLASDYAEDPDYERPPEES